MLLGWDLVKYDKFKYRKDIDRLTWARIDCDFADDGELRQLPLEQHWLCLLVILKSVATCNNVKVMLNDFAHQARITEHSCAVGLLALEQFKIIALNEGITEALQKRCLHYSTEQTNEHNKTENNTGRDSASHPNHAQQFLQLTDSASKIPNMPKDFFLTTWNENCGSLPTVKIIAGKRYEKARQRWKEMPDSDYWISIVKKIAESDFLTGARGFAASIDWLLKNAENHVKISEGNYDNRTPSNGNLIMTPAQQRAHNNKIMREKIINAEISKGERNVNGPSTDINQ